MNNLPPNLQYNFIEDANTLLNEVQPNMKLDIEAAPSHIAPTSQIDLPSISPIPINKVDIFEEDELPSPKVEIEVEVEAEPAPEQVKQVSFKEEPVRYNKNGTVRKKRVFTDAQKDIMRERLAKARLVKKNNQGVIKKQKDKIKEHKALKKESLDIEIDQMKQNISSGGKSNNFSKEDLENAQLEAIVKYEKIRKNRKAEKREQQAIADAKAETVDSVRKALGWADTAGRYSSGY